MVQDEILGNRQTEAGAAFSAGNERIEHAFEDVRRNARAVVDDLQFERQAVALLGQRHLADGTRA